MSDYQKAFESLCTIILSFFFMYSILTMRDEIAELKDENILLRREIQHIKEECDVSDAPRPWFYP